MASGRKTKAQIEMERVKRELKRVEAEQRRHAKEVARAEQEARKREEAKRREWLRKERSRPRVELPSEYVGESIYVHKKIYEGFMKNRGISIVSHRAVGGAGGKLILEYTTKSGRGMLELNDLGPMPVG